MPKWTSKVMFLESKWWHGLSRIDLSFYFRRFGLRPQKDDFWTPSRWFNIFEISVQLSFQDVFDVRLTLLLACLGTNMCPRGRLRPPGGHFQQKKYIFRHSWCHFSYCFCLAMFWTSLFGSCITDVHGQFVHRCVIRYDSCVFKPTIDFKGM